MSIIINSRLTVCKGDKKARSVVRHIISNRRSRNNAEIIAFMTLLLFVTCFNVLHHP